MYPSASTGCGFELNPYESFMRNHLKHYGYYTGQNESFKKSRLTLSDWDVGRSCSLTGHVTASDTEYENLAIKESKLDDDNRFTDGNKRTTQLVFSHSAGKLVPKLREPRNLYALSKEPGPQQAPRWPAEMEVLPGYISLIPYVPEKREPFYQPTGFAKMPMSLSEGEGRTVFFNPPSKDAYFLRSRVSGSRKGCLPRAWMPKMADDTTLVFESRFESGNLMKAVQRSEFEYDLHLRYDLYTDKHTQWFYFRVQNVRKNVKYRFTITNFMKPGSLYNCGMKPLMYSETEARTKGIGWRRVGEEIKYYKNDMRRSDVKGDRSFYSLTWTCHFQHDRDTCYFAHCYPYTYSDLQEYLLNLSNDPAKSKICKQRVLCRSLAGNLVYILTITSAARNPEDAKRKKAVVLTARVHPGETNASWMMKGFLDYLTGDSSDAKLLRDMFVFKIVPMLNPDGVIVGNYRCSLAGRDLNRNYRSVLRDSFPSVSNTKAMIKKLMQEREVAIYCDLHGHSRKQNIFIYGCENLKNKKTRFRERIFPIILGRNAPGKFSSTSCKYKVQKNKEGTGRVVMWQMGIMNSYTMEATFCGSTLGDNRFHHFRTVDYEAMGYHFCDSLLDYCDPDQTKCDEIYRDLEEKLKEDILNHLERKGTPLPEGETVDLNQDFTSGVESSTTGSDSSADDGLPVHLLALAPKLTKKKKLKSRKERDKKRNSLDKSKNRALSSRTSSSGKAKPETPKIDEKSLTTKQRIGESKEQRCKHPGRQTVHSAGRARHIQNRSGDGFPVYAQERCRSKTLQKTDYLERLTSAYLMHGVLKSTSQDTPPFRYSTSGFGVSSSGLPLAHLEGLCPHHEKAFSDEYVVNQLAGLTFEEDSADWVRQPTEYKQPTIVQDRSSSTLAKPTAYSHINMATMRSQSQSPPHFHSLPLDEYIRPTSRPRSNIRTGAVHRTNIVLRSESRGMVDEAPVEGPPPRPSSYADFILREVEKPSSPQPQSKYSSSSTFGLEDYPSAAPVPRVSPSAGRDVPTPNRTSSDRSIMTPVFIESSREAPMFRGRLQIDRSVMAPVFIESRREAPMYRDSDHRHCSRAVLRARNTPVKVVSGSSPVDGSIGVPLAGMERKVGVHKTSKELISPSPPQVLEEATLRQMGSGPSSPRRPDVRPVKDEPKTHRCTLEATPISDPLVLTKQASQSSHHFKPSNRLHDSKEGRVSVHSQEAADRLHLCRQAAEPPGSYRLKRSANFTKSPAVGFADKSMGSLLDERSISVRSNSVAGSANKNMNNNTLKCPDSSVVKLYLQEIMRDEVETPRTDLGETPGDAAVDVSYEGETPGHDPSKLRGNFSSNKLMSNGSKKDLAADNQTGSTFAQDRQPLSREGRIEGSAMEQGKSSRDQLFELMTAASHEECSMSNAYLRDRFEAENFAASEKVHRGSLRHMRACQEPLARGRGNVVERVSTAKASKNGGSSEDLNRFEDGRQSAAKVFRNVVSAEDLNKLENGRKHTAEGSKNVVSAEDLDRFEDGKKYTAKVSRNVVSSEDPNRLEDGELYLTDREGSLWYVNKLSDIDIGLSRNVDNRRYDKIRWNTADTTSPMVCEHSSDSREVASSRRLVLGVQQGVDIGPPRDYMKWEVVPPRTTSSRFITISKLPIQRRWRGSGERYKEDVQDRGENGARGAQLLLSGADERHCSEGTRRDFGFMKSESMRLHSPVSNKMVAIVPPMKRGPDKQ